MKASRYLKASACGALVVGLTTGLTTDGYALSTPRNGAKSPITLTIADYQGGVAWYAKLLQTYESEHPNIHIEATHVAQSSFVSKVLTDAAGGNIPDLILGDNPDVPDFLRVGIIVPLNKLMASDKLSPSDFYSGPMQAATWDHNVYGLPIGSNVELLWYNKGLLAKAGLPVPHTWAQLAAAAKKLNDPAHHVYGFYNSGYPGEETTWDWETYLWELGGSLTKIDSPAGIQSMTFYTSFVKDGTAPKAELTTAENSGAATLFADGQLALAEMGTWNFSTVTTTAKKTGVKWGVTTLPTPKAGETPLVPFGGEDWSIGKTNAAHESAAWNFIKWFYEPHQLLPSDQAQGYLPPLKSDAASFEKSSPLFAAIATEMRHSVSRTTNYTYNYPAASQIIWTAIGSIMDGTTSVKSGLVAAQAKLAPFIVAK